LSSCLLIIFIFSVLFIGFSLIIMIYDYFQKKVKFEPHKIYLYYRLTNEI